MPPSSTEHDTGTGYKHCLFQLWKTGKYSSKLITVWKKLSETMYMSSSSIFKKNILFL